MSHQQQFHTLVTALLQHLGFAPQQFASDQDLIGLMLDDRITLYFEAPQDDSDDAAAAWLMLAELPPGQAGSPQQQTAFAAGVVQIGNGDWQPLATLDDAQQLRCWLRLPLYQLDLPTVLDAFDALVVTAEDLLAGIDVILQAAPSCLWIPMVDSGPQAHIPSIAPSQI